MAEIGGFLKTCSKRLMMVDTVDGRNPAKQLILIGSLSHYLQGLSTISGGCLGFLNYQQ